MIDPNSDTWKTISKSCKAQREELINELIAGTPNDDQIRGRIQQIDETLRLERPDKSPPLSTSDYL